MQQGIDKIQYIVILHVNFNTFNVISMQKIPTGFFFNKSTPAPAVETKQSNNGEMPEESIFGALFLKTLLLEAFEQKFRGPVENMPAILQRIRDHQSGAGPQWLTNESLEVVATEIASEINKFFADRGLDISFEESSSPMSYLGAYLELLMIFETPGDPISHTGDLWAKHKLNYKTLEKVLITIPTYGTVFQILLPQGACGFKNGAMIIANAPDADYDLFATGLVEAMRNFKMPWVKTDMVGHYAMPMLYSTSISADMSDMIGLSIGMNTVTQAKAVSKLLLTHEGVAMSMGAGLGVLRGDNPPIFAHKRPMMLLYDCPNPDGLPHLFDYVVAGKDCLIPARMAAELGITGVEREYLELTYL